MSAMQLAKTTNEKAVEELDVPVIGAGFAMKTLLATAGPVRRHSQR